MVTTARDQTRCRDRSNSRLNRPRRPAATRRSRCSLGSDRASSALRAVLAVAPELADQVRSPQGLLHDGAQLRLKIAVVGAPRLQPVERVLRGHTYGVERLIELMGEIGQFSPLHAVTLRQSPESSLRADGAESAWSAWRPPRSPPTGPAREPAHRPI